MKRLQHRPIGFWDRFQRRAEEHFQRIQEELLPEHADEYVCVNAETGEYTLAATPQDAMTEFRRRWPDQIAFRRRVDGGPSFKFHGK